MPKMKTHRAGAKRYKVTASGKILRRKAGRKHLLQIYREILLASIFRKNAALKQPNLALAGVVKGLFLKVQ